MRQHRHRAQTGATAPSMTTAESRYVLSGGVVAARVGRRRCRRWCDNTVDTESTHLIHSPTKECTAPLFALCLRVIVQGGSVDESAGAENGLIHIAIAQERCHMTRDARRQAVGRFFAAAGNNGSLPGPILSAGCESSDSTNLRPPAVVSVSQMKLS